MGRREWVELEQFGPQETDKDRGEIFPSAYSQRNVMPSGMFSYLRPRPGWRPLVDFTPTNPGNCSLFRADLTRFGLKGTTFAVLDGKSSRGLLLILHKEPDEYRLGGSDEIRDDLERCDDWAALSFKKRCLFVSTKNRPFIWLRDGWQQHGIYPPRNELTPSLSAGDLTGNYKWAYSLYNSNPLLYDESPLSPVPASFTALSAQRATLSGFDTSTSDSDEVYDKIRIWRKRDVWNTWQRVGTIASTDTTFEDNVSDTTALEDEIFVEDRYVPGGFGLVRLFQDRCICAVQLGYDGTRDSVPPATISVTAGSKDFTISVAILKAWMHGHEILVGNDQTAMTIDYITSTTEGKFASDYPGSTAGTADFNIVGNNSKIFASYRSYQFLPYFGSSHEYEIDPADKIVDMLPLRSELIVGCERSLWVVYGGDWLDRTDNLAPAVNFHKRVVSDSIGCFGRTLAADANGVVYGFAGADGIFRYDGGVVSIIGSDRIRGLLGELEASRFSQAVGAFSRGLGLYTVSNLYQRGGERVGECVLVYDTVVNQFELWDSLPISAVLGQGLPPVPVEEGYTGDNPDDPSDNAFREDNDKPLFFNEDFFNIDVRDIEGTETSVAYRCNAITLLEEYVTLPDF